MGHAMSTFLQGYRIWICKEVSHFAGTNRLLSCYDPTVANVCPCWGEIDKSTHHITQCPDPGKMVMFTESILTLILWLEETGMDNCLNLDLLDYLLVRGHGSLQSILADQPALSQYAKDHDHLGWQSFMEGQISQSLLDLQAGYLYKSGSRLRIKSWSIQLIQHLLSITHRQWSYRNARMYIHKKEGRTSTEHSQIMDEVCHMMLIDPSNLLPCHRHLLEQDSEHLGSTCTTDHIQWLDELDLALTAKHSTLTNGTEPP